MYTCCPHCKTCFRITKPQLAVAQGKVRCGTCSQIFNAREHLYETLPERKPAPGRPPPAAGRPAPASATSASPAPSSARHAPPRSRPDEKPATPAAGTDNGPDLDLFNFASAPAGPGGSAKSSRDELDDVFLEARDEEENTAVIDMSDWDALDLEAETTGTPETVAEEFHAPVHEPVAAPDEEDEEIDLFDEDEEEDTAVIDLSDTRDPFAPHAGVPLGRVDDEDEDDDEFLFDEEDEEDVTAVIDIDDNRDLRAGIPGLDETPAETPLEDERAKEPLVGIPPITPSTTDEDEVLFETDEHFVPDAHRTMPEAPVPATPETESSVKLPELEDFSFETEQPAGTPVEEPPIVIEDRSDRYTYVDPEELRKEDKNIDEIIAEMNAQLAESIEPPSTEAPGDAAKRKTATPRPAGDDFESSFLANLDDVLSKPVPETPAPASPPEPATPGKPPVKPAEVLDIINPADNLNQGMVPDDEVPLPLREELVTAGSTGSPLKFGLKILLFLVLLATLGIQLAVFRSTEIANALPALRPLLELVCQRVDCRYNGPIDVDRIQLVSRDIRDHPARPDALLIKATLVNRAPFAQPFPDMEITLSDLTGAVVARRRFHPREYLGSYWQPFLLMRPNQPVQITLEVLNPGQDAVNFEFAFKPAIQD